MKRHLSRIFSATAVAGLVAAGMLVFASPAQATTAECAVYLKERGYSVGPIVTGACKIAADHADAGAITKAAAWLDCVGRLTDAGVSDFYAEAACTRAQWL